jgi:hypothetical protein
MSVKLEEIFYLNKFCHLFKIKMSVDFDVKRLLQNTLTYNSFVLVYKLTDEFNGYISDSLYTNNNLYSVYFTNLGNIGIYKDGNWFKKFINPLIKNDDISTNAIKLKLNDKLKLRNIYQKYFISDNGKWLLYEDGSKKFSLLYNTIHHTGFNNYYTDNPNNIADNIFSSYCKLTNFIDKTCNCISDDDACLNSFLGENLAQNVKNSSPQLYNTLKSNCICLNSNCQNTYDSNLYKDTYVYKRYKCQTPPNINICSAILNASENSTLDTGNLDLKFDCGITSQTGGGTIPQTGGGTIPQTGGGTIPQTGGGTIPQTGGEITPQIPPQTGGGISSFVSKYKNYIIGLIVIVLILIIVSLMYYVKKT